VASARVGEGMSYRRAAKVARERAGRYELDGDGEPLLSRHAQLVCDWVEVFAPVVFERFRPEIEARYEPVRRGEGTLILDAVPFHIKSRRQDAKSPHLRGFSRCLGADLPSPAAADAAGMTAVPTPRVWRQHGVRRGLKSRFAAPPRGVLLPR